MSAGKCDQKERRKETVDPKKEGGTHPARKENRQHPAG